ncbi:hypothetical protein [Parasphingorhabdus halotolerans]|uniref:Uncharacterized protein n=1 Tax=Parasphingorhabdus halotolerans TaxID=2725558 RepID=A0A6H2DLQ2_9SPHN|nr:hypothetical protein [Parasphingorhabdus halotolerans]QJB68913.1 hypothetical protein HF685_06180 [Parasphingorhabdus halotolerans]
MANAKTKPKTRQVNFLADVADQSGLTVEELRVGGAAFFTKLGSNRSKLIGALVAASTASGAKPECFLTLLDTLAKQLGHGLDTGNRDTVLTHETGDAPVYQDC